MTFHRLKFVGMLVGVALGALGTAYSQQPPHRRGQPILFSEPNRDTASSNLNQIVKQKSALKSLEEELKKPLDLFDVTGTGDIGKVAPLRQLPPPNLNSKHLKELLEKKEKQKDWVFETPGDSGSELTPEEIFKISEFGSDGQLKKKMTPLERFYERLERQPAGRTNQTNGDESFLTEKNPDGRDEPTSLSTEKNREPVAKTATPTSKQLLGDDPGSTFPADPGKTRSLSEILSFGQVESPETIRARAARLQEFKQLLEPRTASPPGAGGGTMTLFNRAPATGFTPPPGLEPLSIASPRDSFSPPPTSVSAPPRPQGIPGIASGFPSLTPTPLPVEPPRSPLASPTFNLPKRKF